LGYVVLGEALAKVANATIDRALFNILVQAGMRDSKFKPTTNMYMIAPSGYNKGIVRGMPANKIAHFLGGVAGNAGLFTIIDNVGYFLQLMLNKGKMPNTARIFTEQVVDLFTTKINMKTYNNTRALGWDTLPLIDPPCGRKFSSHSFGLADTLGSYVWSDYEKNISIALLAAGGFPVPAQYNYGKMQGEISDAIMTVLGY
jgi:CubicO group peptidase (beta-lactamase class C family)